MIIWGILKKQTMRIKVVLEGCGSSVDENWYGGLECKGAREIVFQFKTYFGDTAD